MTMRANRALALGAMALVLAGCQSMAKIDTTGKAFDTQAGTPAEQRLTMATAQYEAGNYGLAERHFRLAVESRPENGTAWLGLAAAYDRLGRFDHADRAYAEVLRLEGRKASILNNQGYSMILRGELERARTLLSEARALAPGNAIIEGNWKLAHAEG
ncbi:MULTISPECIES: tetratricopeptide repeat protein [unclassified Roseitalea]|uniref:tetratricopeptide repeat protein n=1 Tax=unclassified Roseitalea TaxID=2639107 RepID=UPI00273DE50C|nr:MULTISPECIES: tetratricopeptide repeat protein [unclassified Roseitalea]